MIELLSRVYRKIGFAFCFVVVWCLFSVSGYVSNAGSAQIDQATLSDAIPALFSFGQVLDRQEKAPKSEMELEMEHKQKRAQRKEDYERNKVMADQILRLAQELKEEIDKAGENTLSLKAIRKSEEIESQIKKLKSRLKGAA